MENNYIKEEEGLETESTPTLADVFKTALKSKMADINVSMPAIVISYDAKKHTARVQPCLKDKYKDGEIRSKPDIYNVPVLFHRTKDSIIHLPLAKGDYVTLTFADRSLDLWKINGGQIYTKDIRTHHLTDAYATPAGFPFPESIEIENIKDIYIKNKDTRMFLKPNGHLQVKNKQNELIKALCDFVSHVLEARTYTSIGQQLLNHLEFRNDLKKLKSFLENE